MADTTIAANILQTLNVQGNFSAEVTFHLVFVFQKMTNLTLFFFGEVIALLILVNAQLSTDLVCGEQTDTIDCRQTIFACAGSLSAALSRRDLPTMTV